MGSYKEHQDLLRTSIKEAQQAYPSIRFFQRHIGLFYTRQGTPMRIGVEGQADCYAYMPCENCLAVIEIEFKTGSAVQSKEQKNWQQYIEQNNGHYILVRESKELLYELGRIQNASGKV